MNPKIKPRDHKSITLNSIIIKYFSQEACVELERVSMSAGIDNNQKAEFIKEILTENNIPFTPLGSGTNRYAVLIDGYAVKIALDPAGKMDNQREMKYGKWLYPYVIKIYECTKNGLIAVSEYVSIFDMDDFTEHQDEMRKILTIISNNYVIGDIGITTKNYVNWGTRSNGEICILDFAYIYSTGYNVFTCTCSDESVLRSTHDFDKFVCPTCNRKFTFGEIRKNITREDEVNEIGDLTESGYFLTQSRQTVNFNPNFKITLFIEEDDETDASKKKNSRGQIVKDLLRQEKEQKRRDEANKSKEHIMTFEEIMKEITESGGL